MIQCIEDSFWVLFKAAQGGDTRCSNTFRKHPCSLVASDHGTCLEVSCRIQSRQVYS